MSRVVTEELEQVCGFDESIQFTPTYEPVSNSGLMCWFIGQTTETEGVTVDKQITFLADTFTRSSSLDYTVSSPEQVTYYTPIVYHGEDGGYILIDNRDRFEDSTPFYSVEIEKITYITDEDEPDPPGPEPPGPEPEPEPDVTVTFPEDVNTDYKWRRLLSVTPSTGGIFTSLQEYAVPWNDMEISDVLDADYYGNYSGDKIISPLVRKKLVDGVLTAEKQLEIARVLYHTFGTNWSKEWETMQQEYDPIANYDMTENMTDDETVVEFGKTHTKTGTVEDSPLVTVETNDSVHGFNSSTAVPTDNRSESSTGTDTTTYDTSDVDSGEDTTTRNYELTRKGNIGVTTTQQLLQSERDLWKWSFFIDVVFPDIDRVMTIQTY